MDRKAIKALFDRLSPGAREAFNEGNVYAMAPYAPELIAAGLIAARTIHHHTELGLAISDPDVRPSPVDLADEIDACTDFESISSWNDTAALSEYRVDPDAAARLVATCLAACLAAKAALVSAIAALPEVE